MLDLLSNNENLIKDYQKQSSVLDTFKKSNLANENNDNDIIYEIMTLKKRL